QADDAAGGDGPYLSAARPRVTQPELLSRLIGYLDAAPRPAPGLRTDGVWVWPDAVVEHARTRGAAPQRSLVEHIRRALFLLPEAVPASAQAEAVEVAGGPPAPEPPASRYRYLVGPDHALLRVADDGAVYRFGRHGWEGSDPVADAVELSAPAAAVRLDEQWARYHAANAEAERETEPVHSGLRVARVFDGESPDGRPWFSPRRLRIPESGRRERLGAYLAGGTVV